MTRPSGAARLPGLPVVNTGNAQLDRWIQAVSERLEVREGTRGNNNERAVTLRELEELGLSPGSINAVGRSNGGVMVKQPDGSFTALSVDAFADSIRSTRLYQDLLKKLDDVTRFDDVPSQVRAILLNDIAMEAQKRGADIQRLEYKLQSATDSMAYAVQEVTASVAGSMAGVRETTYANADANRATAGTMTQLVANLAGTGSASLEQSLKVIADRTTGLSSQYMLKLNAGKAVVGIGLMASEVGGQTTSNFIVQADKFAVMMPGLGDILPFGVDSGGVYINGSLKVNPGGPSIIDSVGKYTDYIFKRSATPLSTAPTGDNPAGWSDTPPAGTDPLYMSVADKTAKGVVIGTWAIPVRLDGVNGIGIAGQYTESQYATGTTTAPTSGFTSTQPTLGSGETMWMRIRTVTPPAAPGTWGTAVRISGEKGEQGIPSTVPGPKGTRGTIVTMISGGWSEYAANAQILAIATSSGGLPLTPIKGDIVSYSGGAMQWGQPASPYGWSSVAAYIDGSLIVTGTIGADKITAGTLTGFTIQTAASGARLTLNDSSNANQLVGYDVNNIERFRLNGVTGAFKSAGKDLMVSAESSQNHAIYGKSTSLSNFAAIYGHATEGSPAIEGYAYNGYGGKFTSTNSYRAPVMVVPQATLPATNQAGALTFVSGDMYAGDGSTWKKLSGTTTYPTAGVSSFNSRTGIVSLSSGDVTTALGFTQTSTPASPTYNTARNGGNLISFDWTGSRIELWVDSTKIASFPVGYQP